MERIIKGQLIKVPAYLGCEGCIYEGKEKCPADKEQTLDLSVCRGKYASLIFKRAGEDL